MENDLNVVENKHSCWDTYWKGSDGASALTDGEISHPGFPAFWSKMFEDYTANSSTIKLIDIASGNGAVIDSAIKLNTDKKLEISALDTSFSAVQNIKQKHPDCNGIVASANNIPLESHSFDIVTSQFGAEYGGIDAIFESARLVSVGGQLIMLIHYEAGSIYDECLKNFKAVNEVLESGFIKQANEMFSYGYKALNGSDRSFYENAAKSLAPKIKNMETIIRSYGQGVAGGTLVQLYNVVADVHQKLPNFNAGEIKHWMEKFEVELKAYSKRMSSMTESAINFEKFNTIQEHLVSSGFTVQVADKFYIPESQKPLAWVLIANKE
jgi:ubiquinone/menaquinone biosynthesis C-methylase UbiE